MKKKDMYMLLAIGVVGLLVAQMGLIPGVSPPFAPSAGTPETPITVSENKASLTASCYDEDLGLDNGRVAVSMLEVQKNGNVIYSQADTDGTVLLDVDQGFVAGDSVVVRCRNNSDDGYYENRVTSTLAKGVNSVNVPMKKVGDIVVGMPSTVTVAMSANNLKSFDVDYSTDTDKEHFYQPIVACKGEGTTLDGEIEDVYTSAGTKVSCDNKVLSSYRWCTQLDAVDVSVKAPLDDIKLWIDSTSTDPAGNLNCTVVDGTPYAGAGIANINDADSYDSDGYTSTSFSFVIS